MTPVKPGQPEIALLSWSLLQVPSTGGQLTGKVPGQPLVDKTAASIELAAFYAHQKVVQEQQTLGTHTNTGGTKKSKPTLKALIV